MVSIPGLGFSDEDSPAFVAVFQAALSHGRGTLTELFSGFPWFKKRKQNRK